MANIGQVCRRPVFQDLDQPPFQNNVAQEILSCVAVDQLIKIKIDKNNQQSSDFYRLISENGENLSRKIF